MRDEPAEPDFPSGEGVGVRRKGLILLSLVLFALPSLGEQNGSKPGDCTQLMAWVAGGVSNQQLKRRVQERGIAFVPDGAAAKALLRVGVEPELIQTLQTSKVVPHGADARR